MPPSPPRPARPLSRAASRALPSARARALCALALCALALCALALCACTPFKDYVECQDDDGCLGLYMCGATQICEPVTRAQGLPSGARLLSGDLEGHAAQPAPVLGLLLPGAGDARAHLSDGARRGAGYAVDLAKEAGLRAPVLLELSLSGEPEAAGRAWRQLRRLGAVGVLAAGLRPAELAAIREESDAGAPALIALTQEVDLAPTSEERPHPTLLTLAPPATQLRRLPRLLLGDLGVAPERALLVYDARDEAQRQAAAEVTDVEAVPLSRGTTEELRAALAALRRAWRVEALLWLKNSPERDLVDAVDALKAADLIAAEPLEVITPQRPLGQSAFLYQDQGGGESVLSLSGVNPFASSAAVRVWSVGALELSALPTFEGPHLNTLNWARVDRVAEPSRGALKALFLSHWDAQLDAAATPLLARAADALTAALLAAERHADDAAAFRGALSALWSAEGEGELVGPSLVSLSEARVTLEASGVGALRFSGVGGPLTQRGGALLSYPYPHVTCRLFSEEAPQLLVSDFLTSRGADYALGADLKARCGR